MAWLQLVHEHSTDGHTIQSCGFVYLHREKGIKMQLLQSLISISYWYYPGHLVVPVHCWRISCDSNFNSLNETEYLAQPAGETAFVVTPPNIDLNFVLVLSRQIGRCRL